MLGAELSGVQLGGAIGQRVFVVWSLCGLLERLCRLQVLTEQACW